MTKEASSTMYKAWKPKKSISIITFVIAMITTIVVCFIVYKNMWNIQELLSGSWSSAEIQEWLFVVWENVELEWLLSDDWDLVNYSHRLHTAEFGVLWAISRNLDLYDFTWHVKIRWTIDKMQWDIYIVEVTSIDGEKVVVEEEEEDLTAVNSGKYIKNAWLYLSAEFFDYYVAEDDNIWSITIKNKSNEETMVISYFKCQSSVNDKDCAKLQKNFSQIAEKTFDNINGITFYKLSEINSRYFNNNMYRWYFVNDAIENEVTKLWQYMNLPNKNFIEQTLIPNATKICHEDDNKLEKVNEFSLKVSWNDIIVTVLWPYFDWNMTCQILFDPTLVVWGTLKNIVLDEIKQWTWDINETNTSDWNNEDEIDDWILDLDDLAYRNDNNEDEPDYHNIEQFPINLEKSKTFESGRWHTTIFPAWNVTRRPWEIEDKTLWWIDGVNCRSQTNVTKRNKDNPDIAETVASIKIYECSIKWDFINTPKYRYIQVQDGRDFVIEVVDPSWKDFADHVEIK